MFEDDDEHLLWKAIYRQLKIPGNKEDHTRVIRIIPWCSIQCRMAFSNGDPQIKIGVKVGNASLASVLKVKYQQPRMTLCTMSVC